MEPTTTLFTPVSASRTLPLVSRIVAEAMELKREWRAAVYRFELLQVEAEIGAESAAARDARREAEGLAGRIDGCLEELALVGCRMRDLEQGLVEFPAELDGRSVLLSWRVGESEVAHWYEADNGPTDRRPLDDLFAVWES
jgi:hypothetical protein